jgi:macrodomain Ter protein organizer (MatP/YcbG family)
MAWEASMTDDVTVTIEKDILQRVQVIAARRNTTLSELLRNYLEELADQDEAYTDACQRLKARMREPPLAVGQRKWTREELHGR